MLVFTQVSSMKTRRLPIDPILIGLPAGAFASDVRPGLLRRHDGFFEAQPLAMGELPDDL